MPRILEDPTHAVCPSFERPEWDFLRRPMIDAHQGDQPLTEDEATQRMKDAWALENNQKIAAWNTQRELDLAEQEERDRVALEEEDARRIQHEKEAEEQRKEAEKKKPKMNPFNPDRFVSDWIDARPASYALNKINNLEYVELDYFTARGRREAALDTSTSISQDTLAFAQLDDTIAIRPLAALRPSKNVRNDEDLGWEEMVEAKNTMLQCIAKSGAWSPAHAESLAAFFFAIEVHPRRSQANGKMALVLYQSRVRREWFDALKRDEGFNIEVINENLLRALAEDLNSRIQNRKIEQISRAQATLESTVARTPPRRHRERGYERHGRTRSPSPQRAGSSRKRPRSRSPRPSHGSPPYRPEKRARESFRRAGREKPEFFQAGAGPRGGVCAVCLGRHEHIFSKCDGTKLWDGSEGGARKNEQGRLIAADGLPLCFDWQVPRGCSSASHPERHRCSGCGKAGHGAQGCPRAEKA